VLITGGASGLGLALTKQLVALNNKVFICDVNDENVSSAINSIPGLQGMVCDLGNEKNHRILFDTVLNLMPKVNIVINNAAICHEPDFTKIIPESFVRREIEVNLIAPLELTCFFLPLFFDRKEAAIVNISSACGVRPCYYIPLYSATKAGLSFFTESLRNRLRNLLGEKNTVKITEVYPPTMDTSMNSQWTAVKKVHPDIVARAILKGLEKNRQVIWFGWPHGRVYYFIIHWLIRFLRFPGKFVRLFFKAVRRMGER
jgi:uncharacterized oxidoreductase